MFVTARSGGLGREFTLPVAFRPRRYVVTGMT